MTTTHPHNYAQLLDDYQRVCFEEARAFKRVVDANSITLLSYDAVIREKALETYQLASQAYLEVDARKKEIARALKEIGAEVEG